MIGAILVLYKPDLQVTIPAVKSLAPQVGKICLIDNTPGQNIAEVFSDIPNSHYIPLGENRGIAAAQNVGVKYFREKGFDFVIFSDQDSQSPDGLVRDLLEAYLYLKKKNINIATIGPLPFNYTTNHAYITKRNIIKNIKDDLQDCPWSILEMYSIISSFSLIEVETFGKVGLFNERLFIDGVDDEWGWRAKKIAGGRSFLLYDKKISHIQGTDSSKSFKKSNPFRTYYQFRNFLWLQRLTYVPRYWKERNWIKLIIKTFFYPLFISPRIEFLKSIVKGYKDGLSQRL